MKVGRLVPSFVHQNSSSPSVQRVVEDTGGVFAAPDCTNVGKHLRNNEATNSSHVNNIENSTVIVDDAVTTDMEILGTAGQPVSSSSEAFGAVHGYTLGELDLTHSTIKSRLSKVPDFGGFDCNYRESYCTDALCCHLVNDDKSTAIMSAWDGDARLKRQSCAHTVHTLNWENNTPPLCYCSRQIL